MENPVTTYYVIYPALLLGITMLLAVALDRSAAVLGCGGRLSQFLAVGLGVVSIGYLTLTLKILSYPQEPASQLWELGAMKLGFGIILLGLAFLFSLLVLAVWQHAALVGPSIPEPRAARISELR